MDKFFIALLEKERPPVIVRYSVTAMLVLAASLLTLALGGTGTRHPFLLFFPAIFAAALLFDRGSGFLATALSAVFVTVALSPSAADMVVPTVIFAAVGFAIAAVTEALRETAHTLTLAERQKTVLMEELVHRMKNDLMMISSLLTLQARGLTDPVARAAVESAIARVGVIAKAQERLQGARTTGTIELSAYLDSICSNLRELLGDVRPIAIRVQADRLEVEAARAVSMGLIVNELVTNAFKYAFPDGRGGQVTVELRHAAPDVALTVSDDGIGCPQDAPRGLGTRLISLLAGQMGGGVAREPIEPGCRFVVRVPAAAIGARHR